MDDASTTRLRHATAALLIGSAVLFLPVGILWPGRNLWGWPANATYLAWERGLVITLALAALTGFALLEHLLHDRAAVALPRISLILLLAGTCALLAAEADAMAGRPLNQPQAALFAMLAFAAQAGFGASLLQSRLIPLPVAWAVIAWNLAWPVGLLILSPGNLYFPALHVVAPLAIGIALTRART